MFRSVKRKVPISEHGRPVGEHHHRATISDAMVKEIRDLRELHKLTLPEIARKTGVSFFTVRKLVYYERRNTIPREWRDVEVE